MTSQVPHQGRRLANPGGGTGLSKAMNLVLETEPKLQKVVVHIGSSPRALPAGLPECPQDTAANCPQSGQHEKERGESCNIFHDLASEVTLSFQAIPC